MADPKADLHRYLQTARDALLWKLDGLSEYDVRRPMVPTGTNLLGIVKHVASVEAGYFGETFDRPFPERFPWFAQGKLSSRVPKEACRVRAAGIKNYFDSKNGNRKGAKLGWPKWRKRKHGSRFRYDADRAKPLDARMGLQDCEKGNYARGVATLKSALERAQIPIPPAEVAQTTPAAPAPAPTLRPHGEKRREVQ